MPDAQRFSVVGRARRRWRPALAAFVCAFLVLAVVGYPVYVEPQVGTPHHADAIVVLGGPGSGRYQLGLELARRGYAPQLLLSDPSGGENDWLSGICRTEHPFTAICFDPHPATTLGEAREIRAVAKMRGWSDIIVITYTPHVSRARYIVQRCFQGSVTMLAAPTHLSVVEWAWAYAYQTAGYAKTLLESGC
ncbi:YdcF family protein [Tomitella fengzijianii]|uniref:YdcF family protein n=2 Tax=Tomitella fengzijianii TaxID=2597660 RepID=A0A516X7M6_9ACTN|nr:YdcF family protein [Tomitella fengzijianii]